MHQRFQLTGGEPLHYPLEGVTRQRRVALFQAVQLQDGVGDIRAHRRHLLPAQDVLIGHLHKAATLRQAGQARIDETFPRQTVQHHMNACAAGGFQNFLPEFRLPAIEYVLHAERAQIRLLRSTRRGEHFRSSGMCQLESRQPHAS